MRERLQVTFVDEAGKDFNISFSDFKEDITLDILEEATQEIIDAKALKSKNALAKEFKEANIITISVRKIV